MPAKKLCTWGYRRILFLIGCFIVTFPQGFHLYWGNLAAYVYSYYLFENNYESMNMGPWLITVFFSARNVGVVTWELLQKFVFKEWLPLFGILLGNAGLFLSYYTVNSSIILFVVVICCAFGYASGSLQLWILKALADFSKKEELGLFTAIPIASTYFGAILYNAVVTLYINPLNLSPTVNIAGLMYFPQKEVLDRVPYVFLVIGAITLVMQVLGTCLVKAFKEELDSDNESQDQLSSGEVNTYNSVNGATSSATDPNIENGSSRQGGEIESQNPFKLKTVCSQPDAEQTPSTSNPIVEDNGDSNLDNDISCHHASITNSQGNLEFNAGVSQRNSNETASPEMQSTDTNNRMSLQTRKDYTAKEAIKSPILYVLSASRTLLAIPTFIVLNYYKLFGELWIKDDHFITSISTIMAILNCFSRFIWGVASDRLGWKKTYIFSLFFGVLMVYMYYFTAMTNKWLYLLVNVLLPIVLLGTLTSMFPLMNVVYGKTNAVTIFSIMRIPSIFESLLVTVLIEIELVHLGWFYTYIIAGLGVMVTLFLYWIFLPEI